MFWEISPYIFHGIQFFIPEKPIYFAKIAAAAVPTSIPQALPRCFMEYCVSHGIFSGMSQDLFQPDTPMSRAMFITVLARIAGVDTSNNNVKTKFADVESGRYYTGAIKWASDNKIVAGMTDTTFEPNSALQRQQLCVMIVNFAKHLKVELKPAEAAITFADASGIGNYAKTAVAACQTADIVNGYNEGGKIFFKPTNTATRAEAAQILYKFHSDFCK